MSVGMKINKVALQQYLERLITANDPEDLQSWLQLISTAEHAAYQHNIFAAEEIYKISLTFAEKRMSKEASINSLLCLGRMYEVFGRQMEADTAFARAERLFEDAQPQA
jgi:hypothetical protein